MSIPETTKCGNSVVSDRNMCYFFNQVASDAQHPHLYSAIIPLSGIILA